MIENYIFLSIIFVLLCFLFTYRSKVQTFFRLVAAYLPINILRIIFFRVGGTNIGRGCKIGFGTVIGSAAVEIGNRTQIYSGVFLGSGTYLSSDCTIEKFVNLRMCNIGKNTIVRQGTHLCGHINRKLDIGSDCVIGRNCILDGFRGKITIGNSVQIGPMSCIWTHAAMSNVVKGIPKTSVEYNNNLKTYNVVFEDKIWVGSTSTVYSDVTISTESAIMPNSVVDKDVKTGTIVGGNPAKVISRFPKKFTKDSGELRALFERDKDLSIHNAKSGYD